MSKPAEKSTYVGRKKHDRKINVKDIEFHEKKLKRLFAAQKTNRYYYDYYCHDNDNESTDDKYEESGVEESDKDGEIV